MACVQYCSRCGVKLPQDARFCPCCGAAVVEIENDSSRPYSGDNSPHGRYAAPPAWNGSPGTPVPTREPRNKKGWLPLAALAGIFLLPVVMAAVLHLSGTKVLASDVESALDQRLEELRPGRSARYSGKDRPLRKGLVLVNDTVNMRIDDNDENIFYLEGEIRNDSEEMYGAVVLFFGVYDWADKQLATSTAILTLDSGETGKFSARVDAPYNQVDSYAMGDVMAM